jgi:hypothetical protein
MSSMTGQNVGSDGIGIEETVMVCQIVVSVSASRPRGKRNRTCPPKNTVHAIPLSINGYQLVADLDFIQDWLQGRLETSPLKSGAAWFTLRCGLASEKTEMAFLSRH